MTSQDPIIGKVTTETIPQDQLEHFGKLTAEPPNESEVSGRGFQLRHAQCPECGSMGWIYYDPAATCQLRTCAQCGANLIF